MSRKEAYARIKEIIDEHGEATHELLIADAADDKSPLHDLYEWDSAVGLDKFQRVQTGRLLRSYQIEYTVNQKTYNAPAFIHNPNSARNRSSYVPVATVQSDELQSRKAILSEMSRVLPAIERARGLSEVLGIRHLFDSLLEEAVRIRAEVDAKEEVA